MEDDGKSASPMQRLVEVDELKVYNIVDNDTDFLSTPCGCCLDTPSTGVQVTPELGRFATVKKLDFSEICHAAHGLSLLLEARIGDTTRCLLFDSGPNPKVFEENYAKLRKAEVVPSPERVEAFVLSHYHIDHSGGLPAALRTISEARAEKSLPKLFCDLHPTQPEGRGFQTAGGLIELAPKELTHEEIEALGAEVRLSKEDHTLLDSTFFVSGEVPRETEYEKGILHHVTKSYGRAWVADPLIMDDRFVAVRVKSRGIVVFSCCSHSGIVNVCKHAAKSAGDGIPLLGVVGGFHLAGGGGVEKRIEQTVNDLAAFKPTVVIPGHCTGWRAKAKLAEVFQDNMQPLVVGATYTFSAPVVTQTLENRM